MWYSWGFCWGALCFFLPRISISFLLLFSPPPPFQRMSATSPSTTAGTAGAYLPPPPQAVAGGPTPQQQMDAGNAQFQALLKLIGGRTCSRRRLPGLRRTSRNQRRKSNRRKRVSPRRRRSRRRRRGGGTTTTAQALSPAKVEVATVPDKGNAVSYPSTTDMQVKLAAAISQNGANAQYDTPRRHP